MGHQKRAYYSCRCWDHMTFVSVLKKKITLLQWGHTGIPGGNFSLLPIEHQPCSPKYSWKIKKNSTPERARHLIYWWYILRLGILCWGHRWDCCSHTLLFYLSHQNLFDFIYQHPPYLQVSNSDFRSIISLHICSVIPRGNGWRDLIPYYFILAWQTSALNVTTSGMTTYSHLLYSL